MGMDIRTHHVRISIFIKKCKGKQTMGDYKVKMAGRQILFLGLVTMTLLLIGGMELSVDTASGQEEIDQVLQKECRVI
jgi:hypothetical protein